MNYYARHIGDYLRDTSHLSLLEHGIYTRLLDVYYTLERPLDSQGVGRRIGVKTEAEIDALMVVLSEFFIEDPETKTWSQQRCDREIAAFHGKQEKAKASANKRWHNTERNADAMPTHSEPNAPNNQEPITKKEKRPSVSARRCPEGFVPDEKSLEAIRADCFGLDVARETQKFLDWEFKTARKDWQAAWRTWMRKAFDDRQSRGPPKSFKAQDEASAAEKYRRWTGQGDPLDVIDMEQTHGPLIANG